MNILICNDDGYLSPGIAILARVAAKFADVRVVAPECNRSGASNSLTLNRPLHMHKADNGFYYVNGTPADCINLALHAFSEFSPDLVLSGINNGVNMGDDTLYSGTVAAATEAYLLGIPAVAFSLNNSGGGYWETAEKAAWIMLSHLLSKPPTQPILWNVNIPAVAADAIQGCKIVRLGRRHHEQSIVPMRSPRGEAVYWIGAAGSNMLDCEAGTDFAENAAGYITVTPLQLDLTDYDAMGQVADFWRGVMP